MTKKMFENTGNDFKLVTSQQGWESSIWKNLSAEENFKMEPKSVVVIVQAETDKCDNPSEETKLLDTIQSSGTKLQHYNFIVSSSGQIIEALGWDMKSPLLPDNTENFLVLAFIGDFTNEAPTDIQMLEVTTFFEYAIKQEKLAPDYILVGKKIKEFPYHLFLELSKLPQWSEKLSDVE